MKAIVGASGVPLTSDVVSTIVGLVAMDQDPICVRGPKDTTVHASPIEELAYVLGQRTGRVVRVVRPNGGERPVPDRDRALVEASDRVYAFFEKGHIMSGGTGHVVRTAIAYGRRVEAWEVDPLGDISYVGSLNEEEDEF